MPYSTPDVERALVAGWLLEESFRLDGIGVTKRDRNAEARASGLLVAARDALLGKHAR